MIDVDYMVDMIALKYNCHWLIIDPKCDEEKITEGLFGNLLNRVDNWGWVKGHSYVDVDPGGKRGWGKPDKIIHGVEIRYLWMNHKVF